MSQAAPIKEQEIRDYVQGKRWAAKEVTEAGGRHLSMKCPLPACEGKKRRTLYLNLDRQGAWDCKRCGEHGAGLWSLRHVLGDSYQVVSTIGRPEPGRRLMRRGSPAPRAEVIGEDFVAKAEAVLWSPEGEATRRYLVEERKLPEESLRRFRIGAAKKHGSACVVIPVRGDDGWSTVKFRTVPPAERRMFRLAGTPSALYRRPDAPPDTDDPIIVVEGELDAVALDAYGFGNVVSGTTGAASVWPDEWIDQLGEAEVYLALDSDGAGEAGARRLAESLGLHRCWRMLPPKGCKDWNEALAKGVGRDTIERTLSNAKPYQPSEIHSAETYFARIDALRNRPETAMGAATGWESVDDLIRGVRLEELTVVTGDTGSGKTTWVAALAYNLARLHGWPILFCPFESRPAPVVQKWLAMEIGEQPLTAKPFDYERAKAGLQQLPLHLLDRWGECDLGALVASIHWAVAHLGARLVVLDHLHFFLTSNPATERHDIDGAMQRLSLLATDLGIHIVLVVHPRGTEGDNQRIGMAHLKGSSGIKQIASNVLSVWRHRRADRATKGSPKAIITVLKCRADVGDEGSTALEFDIDSCAYSEIRSIEGG